ncbi:hypothetical protein niasHT_028347 [Heterodera trifolii]|uniref:Uncharacterized protein n=1 Tax=Heterodera trifolii TaxID=157864 RepID=A0ABD2KSM9_9BILA
MTTKSAAATIERLRYLFTRHGIPETLKQMELLISFPLRTTQCPMDKRNDSWTLLRERFRKIKGEGVPNKEIINTFLVTYRTTPNDSLPDAKSPAEMLLGRKPRTTIDLLMPPLPQPTERDTKMEQHFNRRFGTRPQKFVSNKPVWARHRLSQNWRAGTICECSGVIYTVKFPDGSTNRFHANQLRNRENTANGHEPLNVLNEAFHLPITAPNVGIVGTSSNPSRPVEARHRRNKCRAGVDGTAEPLIGTRPDEPIKRGEPITLSSDGGEDNKEEEVELITLSSDSGAHEEDEEDENE